MSKKFKWESDMSSPLEKIRKGIRKLRAFSPSNGSKMIYCNFCLTNKTSSCSLYVHRDRLETFLRVQHCPTGQKQQANWKEYKQQ